MESVDSSDRQYPQVVYETSRFRLTRLSDDFIEIKPGAFIPMSCGSPLVAEFLGSDAVGAPCWVRIDCPESVLLVIEEMATNVEATCDPLHR